MPSAVIISSKLSGLCDKGATSSAKAMSSIFLKSVHWVYFAVHLLVIILSVAVRNSSGDCHGL